MSDSPAASGRHPSAAATTVSTPPRGSAPTIPRSASVSASINYFESKSRSSTPPAGGGSRTIPSPRRESTASSGSPKPGGPRIMTPPSREGRRLSYRPEETLRRSMDDQRQGLGLGIVGLPGPAGRRVSEGGAATSMGLAGPSRVRPRVSRTAGSGSGSEPGAESTKLRSVSHQSRPRTSQTSPAASRESSTTRNSRPVLQPGRPSDRPQPTIRVVQATPRSHQATRNISAPPESPITPTRSRARAFSPVASSSKAASTISASSTSVSQSPSSRPRSIKPGTRRTSYQLAKTASNDGSSAGSVVSEFGVIGENGESPYGRFVESFDTSTSESGRESGREAAGTTEIRGAASPPAPISPRLRDPQAPVDGNSRDQPQTHTPSSPPSVTRPPLKSRASESSVATSSASSSFQSATSPSSPPSIPKRLSSHPTSPRIARRTTSIGAISTTSPPTLPSKLPPLGTIPRSDSNDSESGESAGTIARRSSDATTAQGPSRRPSIETDTAANGNPRRSIGTGSKGTRRPSSPSHQAIMETPAEAVDSEIPIPVTPTPLPYTSPRRDRKSPGLTIDPVAPPRPPRDIARPSPPVPVKSPLRRLTPGKSSLSDLQNGRPARIRDGSGESTAATSSSVTGSFLTAPLPSESDADEFVLQPGEAVPFPASYESHEPEEIRFTMLTVPSVYSQDSAPTTARSRADSESVRTNRSDSYGWGMQRHSVVSLDGDFPGYDEPHRTASLPRLRTSVADISFGKSLPDTPNDTPSTAATTSSSSRSANVHTGHSPMSPARSPSMPVMNPIIEAPRKAARLLGVGAGSSMETLNGSATINRPSGGMTRSQTTPLGNLVPSSSSATPLLPTSPVSTSSKRAHLIREIVNTERSYANDMALIRDAYMLRYIRPTSQVSSTVESVAAQSEHSKPSSVYTYQTAETNRTSTHEASSSSTWLGGGLNQKSPGIEVSPGQGPSSFFPLVASASTSSLTPTHITRASSRTASGASSIGSMAPPVGKPLSPADVRTVFLNLDQLAMASEEMANAMDKALGDESATPPLGRDGESGSDRLGETFSTLMPKFKPLYEFYCARQSTASVRLVEIQSDPAHATYLNECWSHVKPHTHAWNLDSMLIKPIQRITKYPLLFDDLLACTTPVHPDYFNIRLASEMARSVAQEIDETKRRKDVVAGVISKKQKSQTTPTPSGPNKPLGKGLKMFRKDKDKSSSSTSVAMSTSSSALDLGSVSGSVPKIDKVSLSYFKDLVYRFEQSDQCVKKFGKEAILWTAAAKDVCIIQDGLVKAWLGVVSLDGLDGPDPKMVWFRKVVAGIVNDAWRALNDEVQDQIIPSLSKLLESGNNPRKVIEKRHSKSSDYDRYFSLYEAKKPIDRILIQSSRDYFALHTQLMEELPLFLEGYMRIFDLCVVAFSHAQARYHTKVHERLGAYTKEYLDGIKRSPRLVQGGDESRARKSTEIASPAPPPDLGTGAGVERHWREGWHAYADAVEHFQIIKPARQVASRIASFHDRPGSHGRTEAHSRQLSSHSRTDLAGQSRSTSPLPPPTSSRSNTPALSPTFMKDQRRNRSSSLMAPPPLPSPTREKSSTSNTGFFGLNKSKTPQTNGHGHVRKPSNSTITPSSSTVSPMKAIPKLRSPSPIDPFVRNSFGLPTISPDNGKFGGLGWSPGKPPEMLRHVSENMVSRSNSRSGRQRTHSRSGSTSSLSSNIGLGIGLGRGDGNSNGSGDYSTGTGGINNLLRRGSSGRSRKSSGSSQSQRQSKTQNQLQVQGHDRRRKALSMASAVEVMATYPAAAPPPPPGPQTEDTPRASLNAKREEVVIIDAAAGWRGEKVLYQCACVASFDPDGLGRRRYRGLDFLPMFVGDLFDIFHEVGRIDELPSFPYTEVGVENDGVLVAQAENGDIGLVICSFLEPLT